MGKNTCGNSVATLWQLCGNSVATLWQLCGNSVNIIINKIKNAVNIYKYSVVATLIRKTNNLKNSNYTKKK